MIKLFPLLFLGCSLSSKMGELKVSDNQYLNVYVQDWVDSPNVTYCQHIKDVEYSIDSIFCAETLTDKSYIIPLADWYRLDIDSLFLYVSLEQIKEKWLTDKTLRDEICKAYGCDDKDLTSLDILKEFEQ